MRPPGMDSLPSSLSRILLVINSVCKNWCQLVFMLCSRVARSPYPDSFAPTSFALVYSSLHGACNCVRYFRDNQNHNMSKREIIYITMLRVTALCYLRDETSMDMYSNSPHR